MRHPEVVPLFEEVAAIRQSDAGTSLTHIGGPLLSFMRAMDVANMELPDTNTLMCLKEGDRTEVDYIPWLDVRQCSSSIFAHRLRHCLKQNQWELLAWRRRSYDGIQNGLDRKACNELLNQLGGRHRYRLRCIMSGALPTRSRLHRQDAEVNPQCQLGCHGSDESTEHIFLECPAQIRHRSTEMPEALWAALPPCTKLHGLVPSGLELPQFGFVGDMGRKELACLAQHNLLDMWEHRCRCDPESRPPQPRWQRNVLPRRGAPPEPQPTGAAQSNLPNSNIAMPSAALPLGPLPMAEPLGPLPMAEEPGPTAQDQRGELRMAAEDPAAHRNVRPRFTWVRRVRARQDAQAGSTAAPLAFMRGRDLATANGEHLQQ